VRLEDTPGVRVFDWNEQRQRNESSSRVFPLGPKETTPSVHVGFSSNMSPVG
jgi:hypothetical protein